MKWFIFPVVILCTILMFWKLDNVDLEASEDIYIADAVGFIRRDPYLVPRYHLSKPHYPASPHPFLMPLINSGLLKIIGLSLYSVRILTSLTTVLTCILGIYISWLMFKNIKIALIAGLVFTTFPLVVRYGRMTVLDPLLMLTQGLGMLWAWMFVSKNKYKYIYSILMGISLALNISIKLSGILFILPLFIIFSWQFFKYKNFLYIKTFIVFILTTIVFFIILNDPNSYIVGWLNLGALSKTKNISIVTTIKGIFAFNYWKMFITSLIGWFPIFVLIIALFRYWRWWLNKQRIFITIWLVGPLVCLLINPPHTSGLSAEWAYLPIFLPLSIIISKVIFSSIYRYNLSRKVIFLFIILYLISNGPILIFYGLRYKSLPLPYLRGYRNAVMGDLAVTNIIKTLNLEKNNSLVLVIIKGLCFPLWMLKSNIVTEPFYHPISSYDYIVTDDENMLKKSQENNFFMKQKEKNPSEPEIYLLQKINN